MTATLEEPRRLAWIDVETTGLNPSLDAIIEIGCIITDHNLNVITEYSAVVSPLRWTFSDIANAMDPFVREMHERNGLLRQLLLNNGISPGQAAEDIIGLMQDYGAEGGPMCGSSVHFDRSMIKHHMLDLERHFSHRNLDVSTVKALVQMWGGPDDQWSPSGDKAHRVIGDLHHSIEELRWYRIRGFAKHFHLAETS